LKTLQEAAKKVMYLAFGMEETRLFEDARMGEHKQRKAAGSDQSQSK
jgi:hypothetical protein